MTARLAVDQREVYKVAISAERGFIPCRSTRCVRTTRWRGSVDKRCDPNPLVQFARWFEQANQPDLPDWVEVNAMTLATSNPAGHVTSRIVLLKGIDQGKLFFYTNYDSAKAQQIESNPVVSLCLHWPHLQRQIRVEGTVAKTDRQQSEDTFRPVRG